MRKIPEQKGKPGIIRIRPFNPLPKGEYKVVAPLAPSYTGSELIPFHPGLRAISDGEWVWFKLGKKDLWDCNAVYAAAHFQFAKLEGGIR